MEINSFRRKETSQEVKALIFIFNCLRLIYLIFCLFRLIFCVCRERRCWCCPARAPRGPPTGTSSPTSPSTSRYTTRVQPSLSNWLFSLHLCFPVYLSVIQYSDIASQASQNGEQCHLHIPLNILLAMSLLHTRSYIRVRSLPQRYIYHYPIRHYVTVQLKQRASTIYTPLSSVVADGGGKRVEHEDGMLRYPPLQQLLLHHDAGKTFLKVGCFQEHRNIFRQGIGKMSKANLFALRNDFTHLLYKWLLVACLCMLQIKRLICR